MRHSNLQVRTISFREMLGQLSIGNYFWFPGWCWPGMFVCLLTAACCGKRVSVKGISTLNAKWVNIPVLSVRSVGGVVILVQFHLGCRSYILFERVIYGWMLVVAVPEFGISLKRNESVIIMGRDEVSKESLHGSYYHDNSLMQTNSRKSFSMFGLSRIQLTRQMSNLHWN